MMMTRGIVVSTALVMLTACGGGSTGTTAPHGSGGTTGQDFVTEAHTAISVTNTIGTPLRAVGSFEQIEGTADYAASALTSATPNVTCTNGYEYSASGKSSTSRYFYDPACKYIARQVARNWSITAPHTETVTITDSQYAFSLQANPAPNAARSQTLTYSGATFDNAGYPQRSKGFTRLNSAQLTVGKTLTIKTNSAMILQPATSGAPNVNAYCTNVAGYNAAGVGHDGNTFGWDGGISDGTRTVNSDGSVTWTGTHDGSSVWGPVNQVDILSSNQTSGTCPISPALYAVTGGTRLGPHSVPFSATYKNGLLTALTITNAQLSGGYALNVQTIPGQAPQSDLLIAGSISKDGNTVASFNVSAFGDGTLNVADGSQYVINDWHVVR